MSLRSLSRQVRSMRALVSFGGVLMTGGCVQHEAHAPKQIITEVLDDEPPQKDEPQDTRQVEPTHDDAVDDVKPVDETAKSVDEADAVDDTKPVDAAKATNESKQATTREPSHPTPETVTDTNPNRPQVEPPKPTRATLPLPQLPAASAGRCAFDPEANAPVVTDNLLCPDGVYQGSVTLTYARSLGLLRGCTRIAGSLIIAVTDEVTSLDGLQSLRKIDDALRFDNQVCDEGWCQGGNARLTSLDGLDGLRCVGGSLENIQPPGGAFKPLDLSGLRNLVEVGGNVSLKLGAVPSSDGLDSLERVWGDVTTNMPFNPPHLMSVYGRMSVAGSISDTVHVGCSDTGDYCPDGVATCDLQVTSQAQLDRMSKCETLNSLKIVAPDITDLRALPKLREVFSISIGDSDGAVSGKLQSLAGLDALRRVRLLTIASQPELANLNGFPQLSGDVTVDLKDLEHLTDLDGLSNIDGTLTLVLEYSPALTSLQSLTATSLTSLSIYGAPALEDLKGPWAQRTNAAIDLVGAPKLGSLVDLAGIETLDRLHIENCDGLVDMHGLESLTSLMRLELTADAKLASLDGLANLHSLATLDIARNPSLVSLHALAGLTGKTRVGLSGNPSLTQCEIEWLRPRVDSIYNLDNGPAGSCEP